MFKISPKIFFQKFLREFSKKIFVLTWEFLEYFPKNFEKDTHKFQTKFVHKMCPFLVKRC